MNESKKPPGETELQKPMKIFLKVLLGLIALPVLIVCYVQIMIYCFHWSPIEAGSSNPINTITECKSFGVFASEYYSPSGNIEFPEGQKLFITESWVEKSWHYNDWSEPIITTPPAYGLTITFKETTEENFDDGQLSFQCNDGNRNTTFSKKSQFKAPEIVTVWFREYYYDDTLMVYVAKWDRDDSSYDTLTSFILIKKK
jgi:hypothetical protein